MKKTLILVMVASLVTAGAAFAGKNSIVAEPDATFAFGTAGVALGPTSTNNDDTCDISTAPAATLLLPYFEVETSTTTPNPRSTLFTITNVTGFNQVAKVTLWTDWSYPVLDFNIWLSPYDVQAINLRDVIVAGQINGTTGTSGATAANVRNAANPNHVGSASTPGTAAATTCTGLFGQIPGDIAAAVRSTLTTGLAPATGPGSQFYCRTSTTPSTPIAVGYDHGTRAVGYATIDVTNTCTTTLPTSLGYYTGANAEILYDNVLIGDYQNINVTTAANDAGGTPMVHIRAVPEGGPSGSFLTAGGIPAPTNLPYTFYDRYTTGAVDRRIDRRQPLPSQFAARYISPAAAIPATAAFNTDFYVWREGITGNEAVSPTTPPGCEITAPSVPPAGFTLPASVYSNNARLGIANIIRFDERENATALAAPGAGIISPAPTPTTNALPETSRVRISGTPAAPLLPATHAFTMPSAPSGDPGGWVYWNLNNGGSTGAAVGTVAYSANNSTAIGPWSTAGQVAGARGSQNWVVISMQAQGTSGGGTFSADFDAAWLANGCTPAAAPTTGTTLATTGTGIAPSGGVMSCVPGAVGCVNGNATP
jgi:hypothetical protein